tara:strand:+ start:428 stop:1759 length:1332 start_codon:yes stop_codon:yes gene_type:complete
MKNDIYTYKKEWFDFVDYKPHKGQRLLHDAPPEKRFIVACCGRRFGKSYAAAREVEIILTQPGKVVWVVAPSYQTSEKIFRQVYENLVIKCGYKPMQYSAKEQILKFDWDGGISELRGKSAEHPQGLIGEGCDLVVVDEASKVPNFKRLWEMYVRPTLSDKKGKCIMISTPDGFSYFYELYLLGQTDINWYSFNSPSWFNHYAFPEGEADEDLVEARRTLNKDIYKQEYGAEFTALAGRVYDEFDRDLDTGDFRYIHGMPVFLSVDFGYRMPAALFFQHYKLADGNWHVNIIDEVVHQKDLKVTEFARLILNKGYSVVRCFGDPAGYQVQSSMGLGEAELFRQATGHKVYALRDKTSRSIASGISHVRNFICNVNGDRRLHIDKKCINLINDIESYRYVDQKEGTDLKEIPLKDGLHDHAMDAMRYYFVNQFPIQQYKYKAYK